MERRLVRRITVTVAVGAAAVTGAVVGAPADAAFPGHDGRIAFTSSAGGNYDIWTVNPDGSGLRQLTSDSGIDGAPSWSPDGDRIVYWRDADIWLMRADGSHQHALVADPNEQDEFPAFAPSGDRVVWSANGELTVIRTDGTGRHGTGVFGTWPSWSPNGTWIVFSRGSDIYRVHPDGTHEQRLTTAGPDFASQPDWSPDGSHIVYELQLSNRRVDLHVMRGDGSHDHAVVARSAFNDNPVYAPSGGRILYTHHVEGATQPNYDLFTVRTDGTGRDRVTTRSAADYLASWQPT